MELLKQNNVKLFAVTFKILDLFHLLSSVQNFKMLFSLCFEDFANGTTLLDGTPMIGAARANGISSSEGGSLTGNGGTDVDIPPPDLPPLPMPRFVTFILFPNVS